MKFEKAWSISFNEIRLSEVSIGGLFALNPYDDRIYMRITNPYKNPDEYFSYIDLTTGIQHEFVLNKDTTQIKWVIEIKNQKPFKIEI